MAMTSIHGTPPPPFIIVTIARAREERTIIMERTGAPESFFFRLLRSTLPLSKFVAVNRGQHFVVFALQLQMIVGALI